MANVTLTSEVQDVLEQATIEGNVLKLNGQLDRGLYEQVNKALAAAGGKWDRKSKGHVFSGDPRQKLGLMLETGVAVDEKKLFQAFYTPAEVARLVVRMVSVEGKTVLEPSAGQGALAQACKDEGAAKVECYEINPVDVAILRDKGFATLQQDFLTVIPPVVGFDRVVMNPPFTRGTDVKHVAHALKFVRPGGALVAIMAGNQDREPFRRLVDGLKHSVTMLPDGTFTESGTNVKTMVLLVQA